ncbi:MAG: Lrp/AsnC family transcriptional regulator [Nanoarchaeota archaeon]
MAVSGAGIDLKDRKILYELDLNCRQTNTKIAKKVGLSKDVVNYRIKRMEEKGIIKGYLAVIDTGRLGFSWHRFFLKFWDITPEIQEQITRYLKTRVAWAVEARGNWDYCFIYWATAAREIHEFWVGFYGRFGKYIQKSWYSVFTRIFHCPRGLLLNKSHEKYLVWGDESGIIEIDESDKKILGTIAEDARLSTLEIAKKAHLTEMIVRYRMKKLQKDKVILGFRPFLDINLLGLKYYKMHFFLKDVSLQLLKKMITFTLALPNTTYIDETIGGADFEVELNAKDSTELYKIIDHYRKEFSQNIKDVEFLEYSREFTFKYIP